MVHNATDPVPAQEGKAEPRDQFSSARKPLPDGSRRFRADEVLSEAASPWAGHAGRICEAIAAAIRNAKSIPFSFWQVFAGKAGTAGAYPLVWMVEITASVCVPPLADDQQRWRGLDVRPAPSTPTCVDFRATLDLPGLYLTQEALCSAFPDRRRKPRLPFPQEGLALQVKPRPPAPGA
jgi:hypothetical protein